MPDGAMIWNRLLSIAVLAVLLGWCGQSKIGALADEACPAIQLPDGSQLRQIDFQRHVVPLLNRFGCNAANCHGSFQGRGGFRLTLFGQAGAKDFEALAERIEMEGPEES